MLHAATCPTQLCQVWTHCLIRVAPAKDELSKDLQVTWRCKGKILLSRLGGSALESRWLEGFQAVAALIRGILSQTRWNCSKGVEKLLVVFLMHDSRPRLCSAQTQIASHLKDK